MRINTSNTYVAGPAKGEIELESISDDPYARIVSIARIASVV